MIIDHRNILFFRMLREPFDVVRTAYIQRARIEKDREEDTMLWLEDQGFEEVTASPGAYVTDDGRPLYLMGKRTVTLRRDVFDAKREAAIAAAQSRAQEDRKSDQQGVNESIATTTCPQMIAGKPCGGALNQRGVCPSCVTGRMGYKYRYTCESCGCDIVTREELK